MSQRIGSHPTGYAAQLAVMVLCTAQGAYAVTGSTVARPAMSNAVGRLVGGTNDTAFNGDTAPIM